MKKEKLISCLLIFLLLFTSCEYYTDASADDVEKLYYILNDYLSSEAPYQLYQKSQIDLNEGSIFSEKVYCFIKGKFYYCAINSNREYYILDNVLYRKINDLDQKEKRNYIYDTTIIEKENKKNISNVKYILSNKEFIKSIQTENFPMESTPYQLLNIEFDTKKIYEERIISGSVQNSINIRVKYDIDAKIENISLEFRNQEHILEYVWGNTQCTINFPSDLFSYTYTEDFFQLE